MYLLPDDEIYVGDSHAIVLLSMLSSLLPICHLNYALGVYKILRLEIQLNWFQKFVLASHDRAYLCKRKNKRGT
jgi:hypothetical protein